MGDKPIENIKVGDKVYSQNVDTGEKGYKEVKNVFVKETSTLVHLEVDGIKIDATETHPFWVEGKGWVGAGELKVGDKVTLETGKKAKVESVTIEKLDKPVKVYNFEVEDWHTYFVSEIGVLVHNKCTADPKVPIKQNQVTTYEDFVDRSVVGDNLEGHEIWQHANLKANDLVTNRLSTEASKKNPVIALDREQHKIINKAQRELDAANQLPLDNIMSNSKILRDKGIPEDIVDDITNRALNHLKNTLK